MNKIRKLIDKFCTDGIQYKKLSELCIALKKGTLKTSDLKKLETYINKNDNYYIKELEDLDKSKITCMVIDTGEELKKEEIDLLNKQNLFDKKITKAYKVLINYKLNSIEDNFENKKSLIIVKVDNNWKLLNPNNYN